MITVNGKEFNFIDFPDGTKLIRSTIQELLVEAQVEWNFESEV